MKRGNKKKFGRTKDQRAAFLKALTVALVDHGRIETTRTRAKTLSTHVDKLVTVAKKQNIPARKLLIKKTGPKTAKKLMEDIAGKMQDRKGGYTRVLNIGQRRSDGAEMAIIEFVA
jgi:large subunit ribosomal protein L17